ncbi:MAG: DUF2236 domain-containing protein [Deltaproteobacteria bacterium]|nr:MAG: DUF2236 domain-containing protein [Deltaproteobacteria bacterium]
MIVTRQDLETSLARVRAEVSDPRAGIYGPGSQAWAINRHAALFVAGGRAALLQLAHPFVAAAVAEHSATRADPLGRFVRTFGAVYAMVFGDWDGAERAARRVFAIHCRIRGRLPEAAGRWPRGTAYAANDVGALLWVHATLIDSAVCAYELAVGRLPAEARDRYWRQSRRFAYLFGIPPDALPADWPAFERYMAEMVASDALAVTRAAADIARLLFLPRRRAMVPAMRWIEIVTAGLLPARFRAPFGLRFGPAERAVFAATGPALRAAHRLAPPSVRYVPAYRSARRRLAGRPPAVAAERWARRLLAFGLAGAREAR